jgi:hypothetical protein
VKRNGKQLEQSLAFSTVRDDHEVQQSYPFLSLSFDYIFEIAFLFSLTSSLAFALRKPELFLEDYWLRF